MDNTEQFKTKQLVSVTKKPWYKQPLYFWVSYLQDKLK